MKSCKRILLGLLLPALLLLAWWWATTYTDISHAILPSIPEVWRTLREFLADGTLAGDLGCSLSRVLKGYAIAAALGICAGSVMGMWHGAYDLLHDLAAVLLFKVPRRGADEYRLMNMGIKLVEIQRPIVKSAGQAEPVIHQRALS